MEFIKVSLELPDNSPEIVTWKSLVSLQIEWERFDRMLNYDLVYSSNQEIF